MWKCILDCYLPLQYEFQEAILKEENARLKQKVRLSKLPLFYVNRLCMCMQQTFLSWLIFADNNHIWKPNTFAGPRKFIWVGHQPKQPTRKSTSGSQNFRYVSHVGVGLLKSSMHKYIFITIKKHIRDSMWNLSTIWILYKHNIGLVIKQERNA